MSGSVYGWLLTAGRYDQADSYQSENFEGGGSGTELAYNGLLLDFHKFSTGAKSENLLNRSLEKALKANKYVPDLVCGPEGELPEPPEYVSYGDQREAASYAIHLHAAWKKLDGARDWLSLQRHRLFPMHTVCEIRATDADIAAPGYQVGDEWSDCVVLAIDGDRQEAEVFVINTRETQSRLPLSYLRIADYAELYRDNYYWDLERRSGGERLKFKVGDRVMTAPFNERHPGTIVALYYQEMDWPEECYQPYQVLRDNLHLVHAGHVQVQSIEEYEEIEARNASKGKGQAQRKKKGQARK